MLIQSSLHSSVNVALSFASDHGKEDFLCDWMPDAKTWQMCLKCDEDSQGGCKEAVSMRQEKKNDDGLSLTFPRRSQLSTASMSGNAAPNLVYRRRKRKNNSIPMPAAQASENTKASGCCLSAVSSEAPSAASMGKHLASPIEKETDVVRAPDISSVMCDIDPLALKSKIACSVEGEHGCKALKYYTRRNTKFSSVNESCSSSKSNIELGSASTKIEVDDTGECSSSDTFLKEAMREDLSEKDFCIAILRSQGLLGGVGPLRPDSSQGAKVGSDGSCFLSCKACGNPETTLNMLICDNCEEAYHMACCNSRVKMASIDEWFCHSCQKKRRKILNEATNVKYPSIYSELGNSNRNTKSKGDLGPIAFMLKDTEPYTTGVRIGKGFQADVPEWSGPITNDADIIVEPLEMDFSESIHLHERKSNEDSRVSSIGNWIQCQEIITGIGKGVDGTICGKWRRAPLFEVQTEDWDCFRSILWDPTHSDCAVPQELETDQVRKQLKYIEMLRPRLAAKRRKLDHSESGCSQDTKEDIRNILSL